MYSLLIVNVVLIIAYVFNKTGFVILKDTIVVMVIILVIISLSSAKTSPKTVIIVSGSSPSLWSLSAKCSSSPSN